MRGKKLLIGVALGVVLVVGLAGWLVWPTARAWHLLRGLRAADEASRENWASAVGSLAAPPVDGLLDGLAAEDECIGDNCAAGLDAVVATWGDDPRTAALAGRVVGQYPKLTAAARARALRAVGGWLAAHQGDELHAQGSRLLEVADTEQGDVLEPALRLAACVLARPQKAAALAAGRRLARSGLAAKSPEARLRAVALCLQPGMEMMESVVPLLRDEVAEVRRAALAAVGADEKAVREDGLLACLHDADAEVRTLARSALLARGLRPEQVELGRLLTHPKSRSRLQVLDRLPDVPDVDPGVWLRRLSHDGSPAVRAAAVRAMTQRPDLDLSGRVEEMARTDPSPTVAQLARYYLANRPRPARPVGGP